MLTLGSLFDGSGGFPLAGVLNGITPLWSSEIEAYPLRVTAARFTGVKQLGDVTKIDGGKIEPVDIITFGSPCQDLSVAGKQLGIHEGHRSNLFFEAVRIIKEMRDADTANGRTGEHIRPRFAVWENVPGAFSSNRGEDFRAVLQALASVRENGVSIPQPKKWGGAGCIVGNGWSIAWRVYDAQYWGVPQRRKRIYLVADFGSERAGEILFEREGVCGNPAACGTARQGTAADAERSAGGSHGAEPTRTAVVSIHDKATRYKGGGGTRKNDGAGNGLGIQTDGKMFTLNTACNHAVCFAQQRFGQYAQSTIAGAEMARDYKSAKDLVVESARPPRKYIIRRLTPLECCRLQGFPDWWEDGAEGSDTARYKMWGNGIALPCAADVLRRIAKAYADK